MTVPVDESGISVKDLARSGADAAYVMPSHQYPTGVVMPIGRRMELLKWAAEEKNRYLIEDDYDSEFRYRGKPVPSLQASDTAGKVIYIGTFSKSVAPAIRVSYMVLPPALLKRYEKECAFFSSTVSRIDQTVLNEFIRSGAFERHLNKMRKVYKEKHDILLEELRPFLKNTGSQASMPAFTYCSPPGNRRMRRPLSGKRRKKAYVFTAFMKRRWSLSAGRKPRCCWDTQGWKRKR